MKRPVWSYVVHLAHVLYLGYLDLLHGAYHVDDVPQLVALWSRFQSSILGPQVVDADRHVSNSPSFTSCNIHTPDHVDPVLCCGVM